MIIDRDSYTKNIVENRKSVEELDELEESFLVRDSQSPLEIKKVNIGAQSESFMERLTVYGNVIKNAEMLDKDKKKLYLENYMLGMNFQFALWVEQFSQILKSKTKDELSDEIKSKYPDMTDQEFDNLKTEVLNLIKIIFPIALQFYVAENV